MSPAPITIALAADVRLELSTAADDIIARLYHNNREVMPTVRAAANSERVSTKDGGLHIGGCAFAIPPAQRRAVADFLSAAQAAL